MTAPELVVMVAMVVPVPLGATPRELSSRATAGTALRWYLAPRHWYSWIEPYRGQVQGVIAGVRGLTLA